MSANEIANRLIASAVVQTQGATTADYRIVSSFGMASLVRTGVGLYNLRLIEPLDFYVNSSTLVVTRARTVPIGMSLAGITRPVAIGVVPLDVAAGGPNQPGSIAIGFLNASLAAIDDGLCFVQVWQFPTID
jgi:hypothetical protein